MWPSGNAAASSEPHKIPMKTFKTLTLLILGLLIFGAAGYFGYVLFIKPSRTEKRERAAEASAPAPTPTPDPGIPEFERLKKAGSVTPEIRDAWIAWIAANPKSPLLAHARTILGSANMTLLFSPEGNPSLKTYTVVKGDSLARIAAKNSSNAELIQAANKLPGIGLQIGQQLVIPQVNVSLELDRSAKTLTLLNNGTFLKEYTLLSAPAPSKTPADIKSKVLDKTAVSGTKRIPFGDKLYPSSQRTILISQAPAITALYQEAVAATAGTNAVTPAMPGGYVLEVSDMQEIFPLVARNASVTIH